MTKTRSQMEMKDMTMENLMVRSLRKPKDVEVTAFMLRLISRRKKKVGRVY